MGQGNGVAVAEVDEDASAGVEGSSAAGVDEDAAAGADVSGALPEACPKLPEASDCTLAGTTTTRLSHVLRASASPAGGDGGGFEDKPFATAVCVRSSVWGGVAAAACNAGLFMAVGGWTELPLPGGSREAGVVWMPTASVLVPM